MKKIVTMFMTTMFMFIAFQLPAQTSDLWCETYSDSIKQANEKNKPLLILFTGTAWCPACMKLERDVLNKPEFAKGVGDKFIFYKAEFNEPTPQGIANSPDKFLMDRYQVDKFPTMVVVNGNGQLLFTVNYKSGVQAYISELNQKLGQIKR